MSKIKHIVGANVSGGGSVCYAVHPDIHAPYPVVDVVVDAYEGVTDITPTGDWVVITGTSRTGDGWVEVVDDSDVTIGIRTTAWSELAPDYVDGDRS